MNKMPSMWQAGVSSERDALSSTPIKETGAG